MLQQAIRRNKAAAIKKMSEVQAKQSKLLKDSVPCDTGMKCTTLFRKNLQNILNGVQRI
jgi:hypothetical protein